MSTFAKRGGRGDRRDRHRDGGRHRPPTQRRSHRRIRASLAIAYALADRPRPCSVSDGCAVDAASH